MKKILIILALAASSCVIGKNFTNIPAIEIPGIEVVKKEIQFSYESRGIFLVGNDGKDLMFINWYKDSESFKAVIVERGPLKDTSYYYIGLKTDTGWITIFPLGTEIESWVIGHENDRGSNWANARPVQKFLNRNWEYTYSEYAIEKTPAWRNAILALENLGQPLTKKNISNNISIDLSAYHQ
jgi:hypothetical protein